MIALTGNFSTKYADGERVKHTWPYSFGQGMTDPNLLRY